MPTPTPLAPEALYRRCTLEGMTFTSTDNLEDLSAITGHERAREAVDFAVGVRKHGYNLFVLGPAGLGKRALVRQMLEAQAAGEPAPADWCYVNNFKQPHRPNALRLPAGAGNRLRIDMEHFIEELRAAIPAIFENEEYRRRVEQIDAEITERESKMFEEVSKEAAAHTIALVHTPTGFSFAPMRNGEVLSTEEYAKLSDAEREELENKVGLLQQQLQKIIRQGHQLHKEKRDRIKQLNREMTSLAVSALADEMKTRYGELPNVLVYLDELQADVLENIDEFRNPPDSESNFLGLRVSEPPSFRRYAVNVIVGNNAAVSGAPVVIEDYPTHNNLLGRIEHMARLGTLVTDFALIKAGALHRANGGYLLVDAHKLLTEPFSWVGLKRALASEQLRIESLGESYSLISTVGLEPEPIPMNLKVVMFGERLLYYLLLAYDPEFGELFRVAADFEDDFVRGPEQEALYARLIATLVHRESLLPFDRGAVVHAIEQAARWAGDSARLSAQLEDLGNLLRESDYCARKLGVATVTADHVATAVRARERRGGRIRERVQEAILRGELLINTDGDAVGQVNGLSVVFAGEQAFAHPTRITATTRLGDGEIIDIQREVELGGPIHSKGVLILAAFLAARYSSDQPLSLAASLVFEQSYGEVEGDSASVAELAALISSLAGIPLKQSLAVTGSVNQHGDVQAIGGVNEKIEGFYDICQARGITGAQGVIIPQANVQHLMLRADVVQAVRDGKFFIYAVNNVDDAIALLSGLPAGKRDSSGSYPEDSVNARVAARLGNLTLVRQAYANLPVKFKKGRVPRKAAPDHPEPEPSQ